MNTEYQQALDAWARGLSDECLNDYMSELERFTDAELDALFAEDVRRLQSQTHHA